MKKVEKKRKENWWVSLVRSVNPSCMGGLWLLTRFCLTSQVKMDRTNLFYHPYKQGKEPK